MARAFERAGPHYCPRTEARAVKTPGANPLPTSPPASLFEPRSFAHDHLFVYGRIRAGRSARDRHILIEGLVHSLAAAAGLPPFEVWVYVLELPARAMAEFGHILPEPGDEADWTRALPEADHVRMQKIGAGA